MSPAHRLCLLLLPVLLLASHVARAEAAPDDSGEEEADDGVDRLALAAMLVKDGHYERAQRVLDGVDTSDEELDRARYHTLLGLIRLRQGDNAGAVTAFKSAIEAGQKEPTVHLYLAQAHLALGDCQSAVDALDAMGPALDAQSGALMMKAQCHIRLDQRIPAWDTLARGERGFPGMPDFTLQKMLVQIDMGLYQEALGTGLAFLRRPDVTGDAYAVVGEAFRRSGQPQRAIDLLEEGRLRFPAHERLLVLLGRVHAESGRLLSAAMVFEEAARAHPQYALDSAEFYRRAGDVRRAVWMNEQVADPKEKARQRLGILLQSEDFESAAALEPRLSRLGLLDDENIAYALAYVCFKNGEMDRVDPLLKRIRDPQLFEKATQLRQAVEGCRASPELCQ